MSVRTHPGWITATMMPRLAKSLEALFIAVG